jgi:hypothetical protein
MNLSMANHSPQQSSCLLKEKDGSKKKQGKLKEQLDGVSKERGASGSALV